MTGSLLAGNIWNRGLTPGEIVASCNNGANGYQIPEPATISLLALSGLAVLRRRR